MRRLSPRARALSGLMSTFTWFGIGAFLFITGRDNAWRFFGACVAALGVYRGIELVRQQRRRARARAEAAADAAAEAEPAEDTGQPAA